jgi:hypothetical protein
MATCWFVPGPTVMALLTGASLTFPAIKPITNYTIGDLMAGAT